MYACMHACGIVNACTVYMCVYYKCMHVGVYSNMYIFVQVCSFLDVDMFLSYNTLSIFMSD